MRAPAVHPHTLPTAATGLVRLDASTWLANIRLPPGREALVLRARRGSWTLSQEPGGIGALLHSPMEFEPAHSCTTGKACGGPPSCEHACKAVLYPFFFGRRGATHIVPAVPSPQLSDLHGY